MPTKKRQITRYKKTTFLGIDFASKLEAHMYKLLKKNKIDVGYESEKFTIIEGFNADFSCFEKTATKKVLHDRGNKKVLPITYTPDFVDTHNPPRFIIECKGNPNERFPIVWKLFKRHIAMNGWNTDLYMPRNQKDCEDVVKIILERYYL
jgi:hypothetical protein